MDTTKQLVMRAFRRVFRPVAGILLRAGVTWREVVDLGKATYVEVATQDFGIRGRPTNVSRVSILTGITRKEVSRIRKLLAEPDNTVTDSMNHATRVLTGWFTAEVGRQPYTVYGLLRTVDSVSPVTAAAVKTSLIVFVFAYAIVFAAGTYYIFQLAFKGPEETGPPGDSAPEQAILGAPMSMGRDSPAEA